MPTVKGSRVGKAKSLSALYTEQQPLGNLHSSPSNTVLRALKAAGEPEMTRGLRTAAKAEGHQDL